MPIFCYDSKLVFQTPLKSMCISIAQARPKSASRVLLALGAWHFPSKFSHKISCDMFMCMSTAQAQARTKRLSRSWGAAFSCKFSRKLALVTCPCAFRLRRLAVLGRGIFLKDLPQKKSSSDMSMSISNAQARTKRRPNFWGAAFSCIFSHKLVLVTSMCVLTAKSAWRGSRALGSRHFHCKFSHEGALVEILVRSFQRGPCMTLYMSLTEDLVVILVGSFLRGPCMRSLQMSCLRGSCVKALVGGSWEVLVSRFLKVRSSSGSRSFFDDLVRFS